MIAGELHYLTEEATRTFRAAAELGAYAEEVERRAKTLLHDLDDLSRRAHTQETQLTSVLEDNEALRVDLARARARNQQNPPSRGDGTTMTRYSFDTDDGQRWHVGWDPAVASYFAQSEPTPGTGPSNRPRDEELRDVVDAGRPGEVATVAILTARLRGQVTIPDPILDRLAADAPADPAGAAETAAVRLSDLERHDLAAIHQASFPLPAGSPAPATDARTTIPNRAHWQPGGYDDVGLNR